MATTVSSTLLLSHKENQKSLNNIESTLNKLYAAQVKSNKELRARTAREAQAAKRKSGDRSLSSLLGIKKEEVTKEKKSIFDTIKNVLGGLIKSFDLGKLLLAAGVGTAIAAYFKSSAFRNFVNDYILKPMGDAMMKGLFGEKGLFGSENRKKTWEWLKKNPLKTLGLAATAMAALIGPKSLLFLGFKALTTGVGLLGKAIGVGTSGGLLGSLGKLSTTMKGVTGAATQTKSALLGIGTSLATKIAALVGAPIAIAAGAGMVRDTVQYNRAGGAAGGGDLFEGISNEISEYKDSLGSGKARREANNSEGVLSRRRLQNEIFVATDTLDRERKAATIRTTDSRGRTTSTTTDQAAVDAAERKYRKRLAEIREELERLDPLRRQTGGPIRVPGSGSGDKVPMILPEGSFVLNRNAAGYQRGGIPTLLEPGESVYGPGQWGPREMMLNSAIPRFQSGGVVETSHPDTGSGYQPAGATDYKGRPVVFSKSGAEAFAKAMQQSGGAVKGSDVASSKRSAAKNASLSGAHPNSSHLYGEGLDASGSTAQWLQANPGLGWKYGYSHGPGSVHFNWKGGGGGLTPDNIKDSYETSARVVKGMMSNAFTGLTSLGGNVGEFMRGVVNAAREVFGSEMSMLFGSMGDVVSGGVSGGVSGTSAPLSGDMMGRAKEMYEYIKAKGYTSAQARGLLANIQRESSFDPAAKEAGGTGHGLFQWSFGRTQGMINNVPNWQSNWKGQIDYALKEDVGPQYKSATSGMNAREAAYWWMDKWERPADRAGGDIKHGRFLDSYKFQNGGGVSSMRSSPQSRSLQLQSENQFIEKLSAAITPVVIPVGGGSGAAASHAQNPGTQTAPPDLSAYPNNNTALDLSYRLSMGAAFA